MVQLIYVDRLKLSVPVRAFLACVALAGMAINKQKKHSEDGFKNLTQLEKLVNTYKQTEDDNE